MPSSTITKGGEVPFRIWRDLAAVLNAPKRDETKAERWNRLRHIVQDCRDGIVYVQRHKSGALWKDRVALWIGETRAHDADLRVPRRALPKIPSSGADYVPVRIGDHVRDPEFIEGVVSRLESLSPYDPAALPDFPDWYWCFPRVGEHYNLLIENGRVVPPSGWKVGSGTIGPIRGNTHVRLIDAQGRMGLVSMDGDVTIPCRFAYLSEVVTGAPLACEANMDEMPGNFGSCDLVSVDGHRLNPPDVKIRAGTLWWGIAQARNDPDDGLVGFITSTGTLVGGICWNQVREFVDGVAAVQDPTSKLWGYIDSTGAVVVKPAFAQAYRFDRGHAVVRPAGADTVGLIDATGRMVVPPVWANLQWFIGKYFLATAADGSIGLVDTRGNVVIEPHHPTDEEQAEIENSRSFVRKHPFVRILGDRIRETVQAAIDAGGTLAPLTGIVSPVGASDIELLASGLWGLRVTLVADYVAPAMRTPIPAGDTGTIGWHYPVSGSIFDLSKEAPVRGLPIMPHASIGVPWELLRVVST